MSNFVQLCSILSSFFVQFPKTGVTLDKIGQNWTCTPPPLSIGSGVGGGGSGGTHSPPLLLSCATRRGTHPSCMGVGSVQVVASGVGGGGSGGGVEGGLWWGSPPLGDVE